MRRKLIGESRFLTATSGYDMTGNVVSETDAKSNTTTRTFTSSTNYVLPRYTTNALGQQSEQTWKQYSGGFNYYNGDLATAIDANGATVYYWYDELGRTTQINTPIGLTNYSYDDYVFETTEMSSSGTQYTKVDSSSEVIETRQDDPEVEDDILTTMGYNNPWQQASAVSFPYRYGGTPTNATYTYDPLGRVLTEAAPSVGTTSYLYVGNTVTVTNPENKKKKYTYDELGNISQVTEQDAAGNLSIVTTYSYNILGKLTQIVQIGQGNLPDQTRTLTYDSLGRLTAETHPEKGTTTYTYDDNGNVLSRTDARGVVAASIYDALNRRTSTSFSDGTPSASYYYDQATSGLIGTITNGKGRMTSAWTSDGIGYSWSYEAGGRVTQQVASIDGIQYPVGYSYNFIGSCSESNLWQITYPAGLDIRYTRDAMCRTKTIKNNTGTITHASYYYASQNGALSKISFGDNIRQEYTYDAVGRLNLYSMVRSSPQKTIYWNLYYNGSSQISSIREQIVNGVAQYTYAYDKVGRLVSATHAVKDANNNYVTDQVNSFSYDQFGNMLTNQLQYPGNPGQDSQITYDVNASNNRLIGYTDGQDAITTAYDATGNLLAEGARSYAWDGAGRMTSVTGTDWGVYRYDALGRRVKKTYTYQVQSGTVSGNIISIYGAGNALISDYRTETTPSGSYDARTDYIVNGSEAVARRTVTGGGTVTTQYLHRTHVNQIIDPNTYAIGTGSALMYGQPFSSGGNDQFAGHKDDPESGLHYNLARSYSSIMSRWPSPDPVTSNVYDPQMFNKYIYVRNDPINFVDPDGREAEWIENGANVQVTVTEALSLSNLFPYYGFNLGQEGAVYVDGVLIPGRYVGPGMDYIRQGIEMANAVMNQGEKAKGDEHPDGIVRQVPGLYLSVDSMGKWIRDNAHAKSTGKCATHVRQALAAGGIYTVGLPIAGGDYGPYLLQRGFQLVPHGAPAINEIGDIAVFSKVPGIHDWGHIQIWSGESWISDFVQKRMSPYSDNSSTITVYRSSYIICPIP